MGGAPTALVLRHGERWGAPAHGQGRVHVDGRRGA